MFRFDPRTGELDAVTDWVDHPNGLAFSPDESILYVSDTSAALRDDGGPTTTSWRSTWSTAGRSRTRASSSRMDEGLADGFRVDVEGNIWTSAQDGIHVIAPDGRRLGRLPIPERTSNCVFGGPDGDRLFITASSSLYAIDVATTGAVAVGRPERSGDPETGSIDSIGALTRTSGVNEPCRQSWLRRRA